MIDTHLHILPGVDDGPQRSAAEIRERVNDLQQALDRHFIPLRLFAGHEALIQPGLVEDIHAGRLATLNGSRYLLLELWNDSWLPETERVIFELRAFGIIPILAHPEGYRAIQKDPARLATLMQRGVLAQLTANSLVGSPGNTARRTAETLLKKRLVHCVASDAHGMHLRPPYVLSSLLRAEQLVGQTTVSQMTEILPAVIINNEGYSPGAESSYQRHKGAGQ